MSLISLLILSLIEGITEFLPISSTGHLIITSRLLQLPTTEFLKSYEIFIQFGAILAVIVNYHHKITEIKNYFLPLIFAFLPTVVAGLIAYKFIKTYLLGNYFITLSALFWGGIVIIAVELWLKKFPRSTTLNNVISPNQAFIIGLTQTLSLIPGVSRAAASILGARLQQVNQKTAVEFSFFLAIPTVIAATGLDLLKTGLNYSTWQWGYLSLGCFTSFISALIVIKLFLKFIENHSLIWFGIYRIFLTAIFYLFVK